MKVVVSRESLDNMLEPKEDGTSPRTADPSRAEIICKRKYQQLLGKERDLGSHGGGGTVIL